MGLDEHDDEKLRNDKVGGGLGRNVIDVTMHFSLCPRVYFMHCINARTGGTRFINEIDHPAGWKA